MQTIFELSKGSAHHKNEERKQAQVDAKIAALKEKHAKVTGAELAVHHR